MRITPTCVPCLLKRVLYEAELIGGTRTEAALQAALNVFAKGYTGREVSAELATMVHRAAYEAMENDDPYKEMKEKSNKVATEILPKARQVIEGSEDKLLAAIQCSIIGNILDFGIGTKYDSPDDLAGHFDTLLEEGLGHNDLDKVRDLLRPGARVVLFTDNCGEIIFDGLLCEVLRDMCVKVTMVVKGAPILTDATVEDAMNYGIDKLVDELMDTNMFAVGVDIKGLPQEVQARLDEAALIISKGMANYESFSDEDIGPIVHLLRTKCGPVARSMGLPVERSVVAFYQ